MDLILYASIAVVCLVCWMTGYAIGTRGCRRKPLIIVSIREGAISVTETARLERELKQDATRDYVVVKISANANAHMDPLIQRID